MKDRQRNGQKMKDRQRNGQKMKDRQHNGQKMKDRQRNGQKKKTKRTNMAMDIFSLRRLVFFSLPPTRYIFLSYLTT
jgi:hypothetical protein